MPFLDKTGLTYLFNKIKTLFGSSLAISGRSLTLRSKSGANLSTVTLPADAITGVKGNSESSYRTGNVNLTAANIGAAASSHTHSYLPLAGGTMTGTIGNSLVTSTYLQGNQGRTIINSTSGAGSYTMLAKMNSTNGYFTMGSYQSSYLLQYTAKTTVEAGTNAVTKSVTLLNESGNSSFPGTVTASTFSGSLSGNASSATTASNATKLATARNLTIGNTAKSFDGSANVAWSLSEIGAAATSHTHNYLPLGGGTIGGSLQLTSTDVNFRANYSSLRFYFGSGSCRFSVDQNANTLTLINEYGGGFQPALWLVGSTNKCNISGNAATASSVSQRKYKENIVDITEDEAKKLLFANPIGFDYTKDAGGDKNQTGLLYEEVEQLFPRACMEIEGDEINGEQVKRVNYVALVPYLIKLCQTQQKQIDEQQGQIDNLAQRIETLENKTETTTEIKENEVT